ncbi:MAG: ParB N-terminal domain-containing protein [Paludibacteraceae bacterium]|nr:ParB N-terminal domain-containing protein [Paludibacteraceae bacterium]MCK9629765.1 ParB N-terminal domain-containing protein [Bacteroidales bacterium]
MDKEIKEWNVESICVDEVIPMPNNERFIEGKNMEGLKRSIRRFGLVELPIYNRRTKHLIGGHQRFYSMKEMGADAIDMLVVDMDEEEELAANLTMNNPEIQGDFTAGTIDLLNELEIKDKDMFQSLNMDVLKKEVEKLVPKVPIIPPADLSLPNPDFDSVCPCCGYKWTVGMKNISIENVPCLEKRTEREGN